MVKSVHTTPFPYHSITVTRDDESPNIQHFTEQRCEEADNITVEEAHSIDLTVDEKKKTLINFLK